MKSLSHGARVERDVDHVIASVRRTSVSLIGALVASQTREVEQVIGSLNDRVMSHMCNPLEKAYT